MRGLYAIPIAALIAMHLIMALGGTAICVFMTGDPFWAPWVFAGTSFAILTPVIIGFIAFLDWWGNQ